MNKAFTDIGWEDYLYWQTEDRKTLRKINTLLKDIERNGNEGIGKPEPLTGDLSGFWSRRINQKDRLIYALEMDQIIIIACRYHYDDTQKEHAVFSRHALFMYVGLEDLETLDIRP